MTGVKAPIYQQKNKILKETDLEEVPYAHIKHAILGSVLKMAVECSMTADDLKKSFTFKEEAPYLEFHVPEKYKPLYAELIEWINLYVGSLTKLDFLVEELEKIPTQATDCLKAAPKELGDLKLADLTGMLKQCGTGVLNVKDMIEELLNDIAEDWGNLDDTIEILKDEVITGKLALKVAACRALKKLTVKDCYETGWSKIEKPDYAAIKKKAKAKKAEQKKKEEERIKKEAEEKKK